MNKQDLRIVFLGTPDFAVESLSRIVEDGFNVVAVVTMPDKPAGRGHKMFQSPVKEFALANDIPVMQPANLKDPEFIGELKSYSADIFVVIAFRMLPEAVWKMPPLGTFNLHASLLPQYRGAAPINHAVINGETTTGVSTFFLKHEIDTGDIIDQQSIEIAPDENVGSVHDRLMTLGAELTIKTLNDILDGNVKTTAQDSFCHSPQTELKPAPKITPETCRIDWNKPAKAIHNLVRGLSPYPAAKTFISLSDNAQKQIKVFRTSLTDLPSESAPGTISADSHSGQIHVSCADHLIRIDELQIEGKRRMTASEFLLGNNIDAKKLT